MTDLPSTLPDPLAQRTALVVGASGLSGSHLARLLVHEGWTVYGLSRTPSGEATGVQPIAADLLDRDGLTRALSQVKPTHVFITSWMRNDTEAENIRVN